MALAGSTLKAWVLGMFLVNLVKEGVVSRVTRTETFLVQQCQEPCAGLWVGPERVSRGLLMVKAIILQHLTCVTGLSLAHAYIYAPHDKLGERQVTSHDTHVLNELTDDRVVIEVDVGPLNSFAHILVLLLSQDKLNEYLLQLLIAVVDEELLKVVVLWGGRGKEAKREGGSGEGDREGGRE